VPPFSLSEDRQRLGSPQRRIMMRRRDPVRDLIILLILIVVLLFIARTHWI